MFISPLVIQLQSPPSSELATAKIKQISCDANDPTTTLQPPTNGLSIVMSLHVLNLVDIMASIIATNLATRIEFLRIVLSFKRGIFVQVVVSVEVGGGHTLGSWHDNDKVNYESRK